MLVRLPKQLLFLILLITLFSAVNAQVTVMTGPSNATLAAPASASSVDMIIADGANISLKIGSTNTSSDIHYQWYKQDRNGTKVLVQDSNNGTFLEAASGAGYYIYQLLISNSNQCTSEISDPFKVYVLPALSATIAASASSVCANGTSTATLTTNVANTNYSYLYQWSFNGTDINGATNATYTTPANASGSNIYAVKVAYMLKNSISATANQTISTVPVPAKPAISVSQ